MLSDLESLQLVVPLSESEIGNVHVGQIATVTIEALNGRKVAAHVVSVSEVPTSSSGAVSYDVTFQLDQGAEGLKIGMSASAEVVVRQAEGVNVPTSAIKGGTLTPMGVKKHLRVQEIAMQNKLPMAQWMAAPMKSLDWLVPVSAA